MSKVRVAVIRGGLSDEYDVSLKTGSAVLEHLDRDRFHPIDVVITKSGDWLVDGRSRLPEQVLTTVDVVFNGLHGAYGEDGTIQRLFDRYSVPYTGSKAFPSAVSMNKILTKKTLEGTGIKMAPHVQVTQESLDNLGRVTEKILSTFGPQYVIKPVGGGSSVGTMMVRNPLMLQEALKDALSRFDEVMVEARIMGREATCGVAERYRNQDIYAFPPIEIVPPPHAEFFDNTVKYSGETEEICPARFDLETKREIEKTALFVHKALGLSQYSRSDFMVAEDGIYFLEVNTLPGLTKESLLPKAIHAVGGTYRDFIHHLVTDALHERVYHK